MALSPSFSSRPAEEETINDPTNPRHYWRYRMHRPLEDLLADHEFISCIQELLTGSLLAAHFCHHAQIVISFNLFLADPNAHPPCMFPKSCLPIQNAPLKKFFWGISWVFPF